MTLRSLALSVVAFAALASPASALVASDGSSCSSSIAALRDCNAQGLAAYPTLRDSLDGKLSQAASKLPLKPVDAGQKVCDYANTLNKQLQAGKVAAAPDAPQLVQDADTLAGSLGFNCPVVS